MVATVASIEVTLKLLGADTFQARMRDSGSISEQTGARVRRAMDGIATSSERVSRAAEGLNRSNAAMNSIALSALKAETSVLALNKAFTLLGTAVGGLAGGVALNAFKNYADSATTIANRLAAVVPVQSERLKIDQQIFDTAQRTRTSYEATANIYSRLSLSAGQLGASQSQILRVVETTQKALVAGGATSSEAASIATQLSQALGSGRLAGDELKSIAENSPVLIQAIAKEFGVSVGALKDMGANGELVADRVFKAILKAGNEIDEVFARTTPTIAAGIQQIDNALTRYIGNVDKSLGATKALTGALGFIAQNLNAIGDSAAIAVAALAGPIGSRVLGGAYSRAAAPFRDARSGAAAAASTAATDAAARTGARQAAQAALQEAEDALKAFENQPRFKQAAPDVQAAYTRQAAQVDKLREASSKTVEREAAALLKRSDAEGVFASVSQTATNRVDAAKEKLEKREQRLNGLLAQRADLERQSAASAAAATISPERRVFDAVKQITSKNGLMADLDDVLAAVPGMSRADYERSLYELQRKRALNLSQYTSPRSAKKIGDAKVNFGADDIHIAQLGQEADAYEKQAQAIPDAEKRVGEAQAIEREKAGKRLEGLDKQIVQARTAVANQQEKLVAAEIRANDSLIASSEKRTRIQAELDAKALAAATQRRAAEQALAEAQTRLGGLAGQVGPSATQQRAQVVEQVARAQGVLNAAYFAEQEALSASAAATARTSAAKIALAGAANAAKSAVGGLVGFLGGPLGAALTAAAVGLAGYEIYQARAAAQVEEHKEAVDRLIESTKRLNELNNKGQVRTLQQQVEDAANAEGARAAALDSRNALVDRLRSAQGLAAQTGESVLDPRAGPNATRSLTTIDDALRQVGTNAEQVRAKLVAGGEGAAAAARQLSDALASAALKQAALLPLSQEVTKLADELDRASKAGRDFAGTITNVPRATDLPLDANIVKAPTFDARPVIESTKASIKEIKSDLLSLGDTDISIRGLDTSREQIAQFAQGIVEARANAMAMISGQPVAAEINELVQAFGNGKISVEDYATALQEVGQKFPSFQPLIDSLVESAQKALTDSAAMADLGNRVKGLDGLVANILVKIGVSGSLPKIAAEAAAEAGKADAALNKVEQDNRVLRLRAAGKNIDADVLDAKQKNPALDEDRARALFGEQETLKKQISDSKKKPRKSQGDRDAESLAKKLEELDQDAQVAALNDFDQKTVRFAQSAKVASDQIQAFIAAAKSGDLTGIPPVMQQIYDKMRQLEGVKLGKQALDELFPGRLLEQQLESVRRAAQSSPEIAANLDKIEASIRSKAAPQWAQDFASGFTDMAKSIVNGTATAADAMQTFKMKIVNLALDMAFKPIENAIKGMLGSLGGGGAGPFGFLTSLFAADGHVPGYASGRASLDRSGVISGPGTSTSDSILARVSNREAIIRGSSVEHYGSRMIKSINDRTFPRFAQGGIIDAALSRQEAMLSALPTPRNDNGAGGGMPVTLINNGEPMQATAERKPDGSLEITLDKMEDRAAGRAAGGRGAWSNLVPGARHLRG